MKNNRCMRFLAVLLSVTIMMLPQINAVCGITTETDSAAQASAPAGTSQKLPVKTVDMSEIPAAVGIDTAQKKGHIQRLYDEEPDLNTVMFKNADGSKTAYYYNYPVKYTDENGKVKDITLDIVSSTKAAGAFESKDTFAKSMFSQKLTDGITLSSDGVSLRLVPVFEQGIVGITPIAPGAEMLSSSTAASSSAAVLSGDKVIYEYDSKTSYEYTLTYAGFKEDIVVSEYTGQTEYVFTLYTNGLTLTEIKDDYYLCNEKGEIKAALGSIIIFTADWQNNTFGSMSAESIIENEEYLLTIHVDAEYLSDPKTKYPIRIDPTLEISYENNGAGAIEDIVVNSADELSGSDGEISAGKWGSDNSVSRILMRFPNLSDELAAMGSITSATVYIHDLMCQYEYLTLDCYPFTGPVWSESSATWDNTDQDQFSASGFPLLDSYEISYYTGIEFDTPHEYEYDITAAVSGWKSGAYDIEKGIIFKAADDHEADTVHNYKTFASFNRANYKPYLVIEYTDPDPDPDPPSLDCFEIIIDKDYLVVGESITLTTTAGVTLLSWSSADTSVITVSNTSQKEASKNITAVSVGETTITAKYVNNSTNETISASILVCVYDSLGLADFQCYYIMNYATERFLVADYISDDNMQLKTETKHDATMFYNKWWLGYENSASIFKIVSMPEQDPFMFICVDGTFVHLSTYYPTIDLNSHFSIIRINDGEQEGLYLVKYGDCYLTSSSSGVYLSDTVSIFSYWSFMKSTDNTASIVTFNHTENDGGLFNTTAFNSDFLMYTSVWNCSPRNAYVNISPSEAFNVLKDSEIFVFVGHGEPGVIHFQTDNGVSVGAILADNNIFVISGSDVCNMGDLSHNALANSKCVLFISCHSGVDSGLGYNLVDVAFQKGAHFALGTTCAVGLDDGLEFLSGFMDYSNTGSDVQRCIEEGIRTAGRNVNDYPQSDGWFPVYYRGDTIQYLGY